MIEAFQEAGRHPSPATVLSDSLIQELKAADHLSISSPLYNLTLPSTLKAYFNYVVRSDVTFSMQENQPIGLLSGKSATIFTTRGSMASSGATDDFQTDYLKEILAFIGIDPIEIIAIEGTSLEGIEKSQRLTVAKQQLDHLFRKPKEPLWTGQFSLGEKKEISALSNSQVCSRLALNVLQSAPTKRESYFGVWLPEPFIDEHNSDISAQMELDETVSVAAPNNFPV